MKRQNDMRARADEQAAFKIRHPFLPQRVHFLQQGFRVNHDAVADNALPPFVQNAGRNQVQHKCFFADFNRMPGVVSPLIAGDNIEFFRQHVHDFPFAFISPLHSKNHQICHVFPAFPSRAQREAFPLRPDNHSINGLY